MEDNKTESLKKAYKTDEITVFWEADKCLHSGECVKGSPGVFNPDRRPWIDLSQDSASKIAEVVDRCPSGALSYTINGKNKMIETRLEPECKRAAAYDNGKFIGESTYSESPSLWIIDHTDVNPEYKGQGVGSLLIEKLIESAREKGFKIMPLCPFARKEFGSHPEYGDVLK